MMDNANANGNANLANDATAPPLDQIVTKTVHEAWVASGRDEDKWLGMVEQLAELSAQNRGVTLPDTREAGSRFGESIKKEARKDPDQLLYAVVDRAVRRVGKRRLQQRRRALRLTSRSCCLYQRFLRQTYPCRSRSERPMPIPMAFA